MSSSLINLLARPGTFYATLRGTAIATHELRDVTRGLLKFAEQLDDHRDSFSQDFVSDTEALREIEQSNAGAIQKQIVTAAESLKFVPQARLIKIANDLMDAGLIPAADRVMINGIRYLLNPTCDPEVLPRIGTSIEVDDSIDFLPTSVEALRAEAANIPKWEREYLTMLKAQAFDASLAELSDRQIRREMSKLARDVRKFDIPLYRKTVHIVQERYPDHTCVLFHRGAMGLDLALQTLERKTIALNISSEIRDNHQPDPGDEVVAAYLEQQGITEEAILNPEDKFLLIDSGLCGTVIFWLHTYLFKFAGFNLSDPFDLKSLSDPLSSESSDKKVFLERLPGLLMMANPNAYYEGIRQYKHPEQNFFPGRFMDIRLMIYLVRSGLHLREALKTEDRPHAHNQATQLIQGRERIYPLHVRHIGEEATNKYDYPVRVTQRQKLLAWRWKVEVVRAFLK